MTLHQQNGSPPAPEFLYRTSCPSPVGELTLAGTGTALTGLWIAGQRYFPADTDAWLRQDDLPLFRQVRNWLDRYFSGKAPSPAELPLAPAGTLFRRTVWDILCSIPYGETMTYKEVAAKAARHLHKAQMAAQAAGGAAGHNPIAIIIPCHRVVGTDSSLTGYAGGLEVKLRLLQLEGVISSLS